MFRSLAQCLYPAQPTALSENSFPKLEVVAAPAWTPEDAAVMASFLKSPLGHKLFLNFQARVLENAITGCQEDGNTLAAAKRAEGWHEALCWLVSLSRVSRVADTNDTQLPDDAEALRDLVAS